ncbi:MULTISPECIES: PP2C family protein-serine/threonine phosphatase [Niallia]|uniref:PP2C family protein-serine/threonine phosphatase n=1 Tax=Niallia TaxID=2837506 RepID=UPI001EDA2143|nr:MULTISPECIES: SpoIIE family protein phosphatase [Niallia]MED4037429.1 SpoIIE family protein phosphatase [Niallia taxi]UPO91089.1 SpoIIE family protein phosphatase [Niallia sp. Man26]
MKQINKYSGSKWIVFLLALYVILELIIFLIDYRLFEEHQTLRVFLHLPIGLLIIWLYWKERKETIRKRELLFDLEQVTLRHFTLFNNNLYLAIVVNNEGIITDVNERVTDVLGEELIGSHFKDLLFHQETSKSLENFEDVLKGKMVDSTDIIKDKQENPVYVEYKSVPLIIQGKIDGACVIAKDITEKRKMEEEINKDLEIAAILQKSVLCKPLITDEVQIDGQYIPAHNIGGDMYVWYKINKHQYGVLIMDVMGHGVSAALVSMSIRALLEGLIVRVKEPVLVMETLNTHMHKLFNDHMNPLQFFTALYAVVDTEAMYLTYINAGHPPGLLIQNGNAELLNSNCVPLGILEEIQPETERIPLENSTKLLLFTDGLLESIGAGMSDAVNHLKETALTNIELNSKSLLEIFLTDADTSKQDDISFVKMNINK